MESIDIFLRVFLLNTKDIYMNTIRGALSEAVAATWCYQRDGGSKIRLIANGKSPSFSGTIVLLENNFHIASKRVAEDKSIGPIYIIADDDCLPLGNKFVERGLRIINSHPEYGILTATSVCDGPYPGDNKNLPDVVDMHAVGGIAFVRKGILKEFKDCEPSHIDGMICDEMNSNGFKTGIMPHLRFNHLGFGWSITNPDYWNWTP